MTTRWGFVDTGHGKRPRLVEGVGKLGIYEVDLEKQRINLLKALKLLEIQAALLGIRKATGPIQHISIPNGKSMLEIAQRNYLWSPRIRAPCRLWKQVATSKIHAAPGPYWSIWQKKCAWFVSLAQFLLIVVGIANGPKESFALKDGFLPGFAHKGFPSNRSCHHQK